MKGRRGEIAPLLSREKFLSRSIISASFSLVEAFLSGLFFTAVNTKSLGTRHCDAEFLSLRRETRKCSASLKGRLDRIVKFASAGEADGKSEPFRPFIEIGKQYRDAIHHTTPFARSDLEAGERLLALYEINSNTAALCALLSLDCVLMISKWIYNGEEETAITNRCRELRQKAILFSTQQGRATVA